MSEALRIPTAVDVALRDPLTELLPPLRPEEVNDNELRAVPREGERRGFEIPAGIWATMIGCYGVFLAALLGATGGARAAFMIAISAGYVAMFFGLAKVMLRHAPQQPRSPLDRPGGRLQTFYGPLGRGEVIAQMLVVPMAIAFFGIAILVIRLAVA